MWYHNFTWKKVIHKNMYRSLIFKILYYVSSMWFYFFLHQRWICELFGLWYNMGLSLLFLLKWSHSRINNSSPWRGKQLGSPGVLDDRSSEWDSSSSTFSTPELSTPAPFLLRSISLKAREVIRIISATAQLLAIGAPPYHHFSLHCWAEKLKN